MREREHAPVVVGDIEHGRRLFRIYGVQYCLVRSGEEIGCYSKKAEEEYNDTEGEQRAVVLRLERFHAARMVRR